jgi:hypothetical protein
MSRSGPVNRVVPPEPKVEQTLSYDFTAAPGNVKAISLGELPQRFDSDQSG